MSEEITSKLDRLLGDIEERVTELCGRSGQNTSYPDVIKAFQELAKPLLKLRETQPEQQLKALNAFLDQIEIPDDIPEGDTLAQDIALKAAMLQNQVHRLKDFTQATLQSDAQTKRKSVEKQLTQTLQAIERLEEKVDAIQDDHKKTAKGDHRSSDPDVLARFVRENISLNLADPANAVQANLKVVTALTNLTRIELKRSIDTDIAQAKWLLDQFLNIANWLKDLISAGLEKTAGLTQQSAANVLSAITDMSRALGNLLAAEIGQNAPEEDAIANESDDTSWLSPWSPPSSSFVSNVLSVFSTDFAIKLGTSNTLIYQKGRGVVVDEPAVMAYIMQGGYNMVYAVGNDAKKMLGKTPINMKAIRPMRDGVIADYVVAEEMVKHFIRKVHNNRTMWVAPKIIIITVPSSSTSMERRAIHQSALAAGASNVFLIDRPLAAAIGAGLPIEEPAASMIVEIGGGTTEVGVFSQGHAIYSRSPRVGGDKMDEAIMNYMRGHQGTLIGEMAAERIKKQIGTAIGPESGVGMTVTVRGRGTLDGIPREITINENMMVEALRKPVQEIVDAVRIALEAMPPELAADLVDRGIVLCGGGALLKGIDKLISLKTRLPVMIAHEPLTCSVHGAGYVLENFNKLKGILSPEV